MLSLKEERSSRTDEIEISVLHDVPRNKLCSPEVVIGRLLGFDDGGRPLVDFPGQPTSAPLPALATMACAEDAIGREVALLFCEGDPRRPLMIGLVKRADVDNANAAEQTSAEQPSDTFTRCEAVVDGQRVVVSAENEIVLSCGKASITLTRAGKVLIRGAYLLSRSSGVNRIKGGSVQIN